MSYKENNHMDLYRVLQAQLARKEKELRFISDNLEELIKRMWQKGAEESVDHFKQSDGNHMNLWRGNSIDHDLKSNTGEWTIYGKLEKEIEEIKQKGVKED